MKSVRDILAMRASRRGEPVVLGTVVDVRGSAYRRPGARMLLTRDGERVGMISGGCLDKDLVRHAWSWTEAGPRTVLYDTRGDELLPQGPYGSGCDGLVQLLIERLPVAEDAIDPLEVLELLMETREPTCMATVYAGEGRYEGLVGARGLWSAAEGWCVDGRWPESLSRALSGTMVDASGWRRPRSWALEVAKGSVTVLVEPLSAPRRLAVFGAGDDAQPLVAMALAMGWEVVVADKWPALAASSRFPGATQVVCAPPEKQVSAVSPDAGTAVVVMTHQFEDDKRLLPGLLASSAPVVGLMGPRSRTASLMRALLATGWRPAPAELARLQAPVGLDMGVDAPEEVALSVLGGLLAALQSRPAGLLRASQGDIHAEHQRTLVASSEKGS